MAAAGLQAFNWLQLDNLRTSLPGPEKAIGT